MNTSIVGANTAYPDAVVIRSDVALGRPYRDYLQNLRYDFWFSCAYCSIAETEAAGISFEIDHYEPQSRAASHVHEYDNLMYSCGPCNLSKSNIWTSLEDQAKGFRFLRPDHDNLAAHYKLIGDSLVSQTVEGEFTREILRLNRYALRQVRALRRRLGDADESIVGGLQTLARMNIDAFPKTVRSRFAKLKRELSELGEKTLSEDEDPKVVLRALNKSPLLGDGFAEELAAARVEKATRRAYLKSLGARVP